jgi:hypothetical protein
LPFGLPEPGLAPPRGIDLNHPLWKKFLPELRATKNGNQKHCNNAAHLLKRKENF